MSWITSLFNSAFLFVKKRMKMIKQKNEAVQLMTIEQLDNCMLIGVSLDI